MAQITIIGLGIVGNSIGLALRRYSQSPEGKASPFTVIGYDASIDLQQAAQRKVGSIDRTSWDLPSAVKEANFVIITTPTMEVREILTAIAPHLRDGAIVSDTASSKEVVLRWATEILPANVSFVGGHPMATRAPAPLVLGDKVEETPADADMFRGSPYCIMPLPNASDAAVSQVISLAGLLGAEPFFVDPAEHDSFVAAVEHLPALAAVTMLRLATKSPTSRELSTLAGGAFRDITRMASADPRITRDSLIANREHLLRWLDAYMNELGALRDMIVESADSAAPTPELETTLQEARDAYFSWSQPKSLGPEMAVQQTAMNEATQGRLTRTFLGGLLGGGTRVREDDKRKK